MIVDIIHIAVLCIVLGGLSIPLSFNVSSSPLIVWIGNALGSVLSAFVVIYIGDRINNKKDKQKMGKKRFTKKIITVFEESEDNQKVQKVRFMVNKYGLRIFSLLCPIFPGVLISTAAVYLFDLDKRIYKKWMFSGVVLVSGFYVFSYWLAFVQ